jgi:hypothetical protein
VLHGILSWPERHVGLAWWIAIIVSSPVWIKWAWRGLRTLPIWGARFQRQQLAVRIRVLERLHGDTNRLVLYLARDVLDLAWDFGWMSCIVAWMAIFKGHAFAVSPAIFFVFILGSSLLGNVTRLRRLVRDLQNYDTAIAELKRKQERP